jgi:hypothetical protein
MDPADVVFTAPSDNVSSSAISALSAVASTRRRVTLA